MWKFRYKYKCIICGEWHSYGQIYHEKDEYGKTGGLKNG